MKSDICVSIGVTEDLEFAAGVTILNFISVHGVKGFHFMVYSDKPLKILSEVFSRMGLQIDVVVFRPKVPWRLLWGSRAVSYFSPLVLSKFESFSLLTSFSRVVWLDYDTVILSPITSVFDSSAFDFAYMKSKQPVGNGFLKLPSGINSSEEGMSGALFLLNESFPNHQSASLELYEIFEGCYNNLVFPEQAVFDIFLRRLSFNYLELDPEIYCAYPGKESKDAKIIHSWGPKKFWNGLHDPRWIELYSNWLEIGGSKHSATKSKIRKLMRMAKYVIASWVNALIGVISQSRKLHRY